MKNRVGAVTLVAVFLMAALAVPAIASGHIFQANLTTGAEVHGVLDSNATGHAKFTVTDAGIEFTLKASRLTGPAWGAHIHGPAGPDGNAGIVARLCGLPHSAAAAECLTNEIGKLRVSGVITEDNLSGVTFAELVALMETGDAYVNVHTDLNPAGELRGQIR